MSVVLILGSGPNVVASRVWARENFDRIVAINNAWAVRPDWDDLIHPDDFPVERMPVDINPDQRIIRADDYVPLQNKFGGFVYAGGTMAFTASYWALAALQPKVIAVMGCDMMYDAKTTHFYGQGTADPLRADVTLRSLEAKSARLMALAAKQGCTMVNLSTDPSRLVFPRATSDALRNATTRVSVDMDVVAAALAQEAKLDYYVPSGKYWKEEDRFDRAAIDALDALWLTAVPYPQTLP